MAKVQYMKDHSKPSLRENPDHFILHVGINNLNSDRKHGLIAKSIVDIALSMKNEAVTIIISNIFIKNDEFKREVKEVKRHFQILRKERNIF